MRCREKIAYVEEQTQGRIASSMTSDIGDAMAGGIVVTRRLLQSKEGRHQEEREERANTSITRSCNSSMWRRETNRERKIAYVRELLTYCFLALLQCLGRDVGAVNGFCSNGIIWFFRKMKKLYFGSDFFWFVQCGWCLEVWMLVSNIGDNYRVENSGQAQFVMFQFPASLTLIPVVRLVHLHILPALT